MKKMLFILPILVALFFVGCSSDGDGDPGGNNGNKVLSEIVINEHEKKFGEINEYGELYEQYIYNPDGTLQEKTTNYYNALLDGRIDCNYKYEYDDKKRVVEMNEYTFTLFEKKRKYEYNNIDSVSRMLVYDDDGDLNEEWTYEYDSQKRLIKTVEKDAWDFGYISEYRYEGNNVYIEKTMLDDGSLFGNYVFEYDTHGNLLQETYISGDTGRESIEQKYEYKYDSSGRIQRKSQKSYVLDDWTYYDYFYNEDGTINKISVSYSYKDDESELRYNYIYK
ncbi:hypothetical protein [Phocaeicola plebeius]|uniref:hypothetical protein n=1 Tax=Phocaeicola plebeius TaxID=310297 RepID=UPI003209E2D8